MTACLPTPLLSMKSLDVEFEGRPPRRVLRGVSCTLQAGQTLCVIGESGSGKTVGCRSILGLLPHGARVSGSIQLAGRELLGLSERDMRQFRGREIAMVFQDPARALNPTMRVGTQIMECIRHHRGASTKAARGHAVRLMAHLHLPAPDELYFAYPHELSGGMQQRIMIAIALAGGPSLLIADEATRALDAANQLQILQLLRHLQRENGMAMVIVTHNIIVAAAMADWLLVLHSGQVVEYGPAASIMRSPSTTYTRALIQASHSPLSWSR